MLRCIWIPTDKFQTVCQWSRCNDGQLSDNVPGFQGITRHSFRVCHSHHKNSLLVHRAGLFVGNDQTITIKKRCSRRVMDSHDSCQEFENKTVDMTRFVCLPPIRGQSNIFGQRRLRAWVTARKASTVQDENTPWSIISWSVKERSERERERERGRGGGGGETTW